MKYERLWERLLEFLNTWSRASEVAPGRVAVTFETADGAARTVVILMTPTEWDQMVEIPWGDFDLAAREVRRSVLGTKTHEPFLVYDQYDLQACGTEHLPADPEEERLDELARQHPGGVGRWVVEDRAGNVVDVFGPPTDEVDEVE